MKNCSQCSKEIPDDAVECPYCHYIQENIEESLGNSDNNEANTDKTESEKMVESSSYLVSDNNSNQINEKKPGGEAGIICGILSIILSLISVTVLGSIIGIILGIVAIGSGNSCKEAGGSSAGFILGVLGLILNCFGLIACTLCIGTVSSML